MIPEGSNWEPAPQDRARYQEELEKFSRYIGSTVDESSFFYSHIKLTLVAFKLLNMHTDTVAALDEHTQLAITRKCNEIMDEWESKYIRQPVTAQFLSRKVQSPPVLEKPKGTAALGMPIQELEWCCTAPHNLVGRWFLLQPSSMERDATYYQVACVTNSTTGVKFGVQFEGTSDAVDVSPQEMERMLQDSVLYLPNRIHRKYSLSLGTEAGHGYLCHMPASQRLPGFQVEIRTHGETIFNAAHTALSGVAHMTRKQQQELITRHAESRWPLVVAGPPFQRCIPEFLFGVGNSTVVLSRIAIPVSILKPLVTVTRGCSTESDKHGKKRRLNWSCEVVIKRRRDKMTKELGKDRMNGWERGGKPKLEGLGGLLHTSCQTVHSPSWSILRGGTYPIMPRHSKQQQELITRYAESRAHYMKVFELNAAPLRRISKQAYDAAHARVTSQPDMIHEGSDWRPSPQELARHQEELERFSRYTASTVDDHLKLTLVAWRLLHMHADAIQALDEDTQDAISRKCTAMMDEWEPHHIERPVTARFFSRQVQPPPVLEKPQGTTAHGMPIQELEWCRSASNNLVGRWFLLQPSPMERDGTYYQVACVTNSTTGVKFGVQFEGTSDAVDVSPQEMERMLQDSVLDSKYHWSLGPESVRNVYSTSPTSSLTIHGYETILTYAWLFNVQLQVSGHVNLVPDLTRFDLVVIGWGLVPKRPRWLPNSVECSPSILCGGTYPIMPRRSKQQQELITRYAESRAHYMKVFELNSAPLRGIDKQVYDAAYARVTSQPDMIPEGGKWERSPEQLARHREELERFSRYTASTVEDHIKLTLVAWNLLHMEVDDVCALDERTQDAITRKCEEIMDVWESQHVQFPGTAQFLSCKVQSPPVLEKPQGTAVLGMPTQELEWCRTASNNLVGCWFLLQPSPMERDGTYYQVACVTNSTTGARFGVQFEGTSDAVDVSPQEMERMLQDSVLYLPNLTAILMESGTAVGQECLFHAPTSRPLIRMHPETFLLYVVQ
ncbi:hypothetical protein BU15DRAFT_64187 [Melanogaster broomeanus]|nr:hypothetical protein BU15DRAFT_64187 [Melanogaster broomeanus]